MSTNCIHFIIKGTWCWLVLTLLRYHNHRDKSVSLSSCVPVSSPFFSILQSSWSTVFTMATITNKQHTKRRIHLHLHVDGKVTKISWNVTLLFAWSWITVFQFSYQQLHTLRLFSTCGEGRYQALTICRQPCESACVRCWSAPKSAVESRASTRLSLWRTYRPSWWRFSSFSQTNSNGSRPRTCGW